MNLFDYLKNIYEDKDEKYQEEYSFEKFVEDYIRSTFNLNNNTIEGYVNNEFIYALSPNIKLDFINKTLEIIVE